MDTSNPGTLALLVAIVGIVVVAIGWIAYQKSRSRRLEKRFGPEYHHTVEEMGSRAKAEAELAARERRVEKLRLVPLEPDEAARFDHAWRAIQGRFVDSPKGALTEADQLVRELMARRGYPMADFEHRAADISVDHAHVVDHYREARAIALRDQHAPVSTEELRRAVVHYRALFEELLEVSEPAHRNVRTVEVRS